VELGSIEVDMSRTGVVVLMLVGEHDLANAEQLRTTLAEKAATNPTAIVDLSRADFIDSQILNVLVSARKDAERQSQELAVVCPRGSPIHHVLEVTGLDEALGCHPDLESALSTAGRED